MLQNSRVWIRFEQTKNSVPISTGFLLEKNCSEIALEIEISANNRKQIPLGIRSNSYRRNYPGTRHDSIFRLINASVNTRKSKFRDTFDRSVRLNFPQAWGE